ncbi:g4300 [Coccomyxa viridis]|uniref:G4300 protein n=1 Tax=Coccomyxa viridis TaxID=1274662 RepID=A0ABP1FPZ2_9CHLO
MFAALAPGWRLGVDPATPLPPCVGPLNVTYLDFQRNDTFYIGLDDPSFAFGNPPSVVLDLLTNSTVLGNLAQNGFQRLPDSTGAKPVQELRALDFLIFLVFDHDSTSRGYPIGCQIRQLGETLLSDNIQSQLPAFGLKPLSSLHLATAAIDSYKKVVAGVLCKSTPDMPNTVLRVEGIPEYLAVAGPESFTPVLTAALKGYSKSVVRWVPTQESIYSELYRYPKHTVDLMVLNDAIAADVLVAKARVGESLNQVPFAMDAVVISHSVPGLARDGLCLDAEAVSDILQCRISTWNHPNITVLNPGARLPDQAINVAVDPLNFALIHTVAKYLAELAPGWRLGRGRAVQWPPCITLSLLGSSNESHIFESDYVLGFQQMADLDEHSLGRSIRVKNRAGACVSPHNIAAASMHALNISSIAPQQWENFTTASSDSSELYPLGMMGFLVWDHNSTDIGYSEGGSLRNVTSRLLSDTAQSCLPQFGLVPTYQNASAQIEQTIVQTTPDVERTQSEGVPVNDQVTVCSTSIAYSSFDAILWQMNENRQGRLFLLDTLWPSEAEAVKAFLYSPLKHDSALVWNPVPTQEILSAPRRVMHIPIGFAPLPIIHNFEGIPNSELRLDAHALAGLYSCKIRTFSGYIQSLNPNLTLPSGNLTVVAMPWESTAAKHLISYLRQDAMWDADLDAASGWAPCVLQTYIRPYSAHVSQLMLERPSSVIGFQPIGHFLAAQILTQRAQAPDRTGDLSDTRNPNVNVWDKMLLGMWKDSALPVERVIKVRNARGDYMAAAPVQDIQFPFDIQTLPDRFRSPEWGNLQDPTHNMAPYAYPIGQLMFMVIDEDIGAKGRVHAKRMKSFLRYLVTENTKLEVPLLPAGAVTDARNQTMQVYNSLKPLSEPLKAWALQGIKQLPYDPLPPLPYANKPPVPALGRSSPLNSRADVHTDRHIAIGVALGVAITLGVLAAALLIWRRRRKIRQHSFRGVSSMRMRASGTVPSDSVDLKLELDGKGEPVLLGQGSFAKVYKGRWNGVLVAVKILNAPAAEVMEDFQRECTILERLRHPNIIKYFGTASNAEGNVMMVTEYMQGGDLGTALAHDNPSARRLGWYQNGHLVALDIARGLAYLHAQKVISFDVKPANVLLDRTGKHAKLADVGLAKVLEHSQTMTNMRGTLDYMPPEMFGAYEEEEEGVVDGQTRKQPITQAVDVYSFGLVLWQIVTGGCLDKMQGSLRPPRIPEECPAQIAQLYSVCLSEHPERRPKAADLVRVILGTLSDGATASSTLGSQSGAGKLYGARGSARLLSSFTRHHG